MQDVPTEPSLKTPELESAIGLQLVKNAYHEIILPDITIVINF